MLPEDTYMCSNKAFDPNHRVEGWYGMSRHTTQPDGLPWCGVVKTIGSETSSRWPGYFEGAIVAGEKAAATVTAVLKGDSDVVSRLMPHGAWDLPRSHTERLVTSMAGAESHEVKLS
jgi:hypothetical protein